MTAPSRPATPRLGFFKLNVPNMERALLFWQNAFGFAVTLSFDEIDFTEHALALPGQEQAGPSLMLVCRKDGADVTVGKGHGPVGLFCPDLDASLADAIAAGASLVGEVVVLPEGVKVAILTSPDGHEIELVQLPG